MWTLLSLIATVFSEQTCHALSLQGGGSYGSFQVGAFETLVNLLPPNQVAYNAIVGISAGSINSMVLSQKPTGDQKAAAQNLKSTWTSLTSNSDVWEKWPGGLIGGLLFRPGILNSQPLYELLKSEYTGTKRNVTSGATSLSTGIYRRFNQTLGEKIVDASMASGALAPILPYWKLEDDFWIDGATTYSNDYVGAIQRCLDVTGGDQTKVVIDVIQCFNYDKLPVDDSEFKTLDVFSRVREIQSDDSALNDIIRAKRAYPDVKFRYYIQPEETLQPGFYLFFEAEDIEFNIGVGVRDATNVINNQVSFDEVIQKRVARRQTVYIEA